MFFDQYPYTNLHNVNLDWVLQAVKSWGAMVEQNNQNFINLEAANESFKEFVTNYLTNLDLSDEISEKLDNMLASGELTPYLLPYIKTDVENWLDQHITPTTPIVDNTLTIPGAAADAAKVGEVITDVTDDFNESLSYFVNNTPKNLINKKTIIEGYTLNYTDGTISPNANRCVTDFIPVKADTIYNKNNISQWAVYDASKTFLGWQQASNGAPVLISKIYPTAAYMRTSFTKENASIAIFCENEYYNSGGVSGIAYESYTGNADNLLFDGFKIMEQTSDGEVIKGINLFDYRTAGCIGFSIGNDGIAAYNNNFDDTGKVIGNNAYIGITTYFSVEPGNTIYCNYEFWGAAFYDANKTFISMSGATQGFINGVVIPAGAYYARINVKGSSANPTPEGRIGNTEDFKNLLVWTVSGDNRIAPVPVTRKRAYVVNGSLISDNYLDCVIPSMTDSPFLSAMQCMTIREINKREHAWRFGNFNMWVGAVIKGWDMTRKMLMDYGIDFCGFEEVVTRFSNVNLDFAKYMQSWQFPYGFYTNFTDGQNSIDKSFVSRFNVLSSTKLVLTASGSDATYLNCKVELPRYLDVYNPKRILSVYVVHFPIVQSATKILVAKELLTEIATDTSDFVIILGDTNDFGTTDETKDYWVTLEAGGFRPVIPITTKTVTEDGFAQESSWPGHCIDQFLISNNITAISYGVVNTKDDYAVPSISGAGTNNEPALSDHDFVYTDLKFDYDVPRDPVVIPE